jgi:valyl-tRNA synthetase
MAEFDLKEIETRWQSWWKKEDLLRFDPKDVERPLYSFDTPPPYASGALHAGHAVHYTHQDFMARYQRMRGHNVYFPLCFDVNGIPIEERVERERGITRKDIGRQEFIELCSRFADKNIENMTKQFRRLGHSLDESIFYRTDSEAYRKITQLSFLQLHEKGLVYRGEFPVNWCPRCMTAMADAEVEYKPNQTLLNYIRFPLAEGDGHVLIATTRPELIATCQVVAVHPEDEEKRHLVGKTLKTPLFGKEVRILADETVVREFGTGALMVCSIGDKEDLQKIFKYKLPLEIAIEGDGTLNDLAGPYKGLNVRDARAKVIEDLKAAGLIEKQEKVDQNVGACWRCKTHVEFVQNPQWFLKIIPFKEQILAASDEMQWFPEFMRVRLKNWTDSLEWDWVISRQRYFATPIPVWECSREGCVGVVVAKAEQCYVDPTVEPSPTPLCPECGSKSLKGSQDVFDTWMDSSISPLFNTKWKTDDKAFARLFPMTVRPQSHDIIRTWLFYTIIRSLHATGSKPFTKVMMGGFILAADGGPMHKSLGNVIDPLSIIEKHGAEALRYYATTCSLGEDNAVRFQDFVRGERFARKYHNIQSFIGHILKDKKAPAKAPAKLPDVDQWILSAFARARNEVTDHLDNFAYAPAMKVLEQFAWKDVADNYLELVKTRAYDADPAALWTLKTIGLGLSKLLAPFFPHVTEEAYQTHYRARTGPRSIHVSTWPEAPEFDSKAADRGGLVKDLVAAVRAYKSGKKLALNAPLDLVEVFAATDAEAVENNLEDLKAALQIKTLKLASADEKLTKIVVGVRPVFAKIGPQFKKEGKAIIEYIKAAEPAEIAQQMAAGAITVPLAGGESVSLGPEFVELVEGYSVGGHQVDVVAAGPYTVTVASQD